MTMPSVLAFPALPADIPVALGLPKGVFLGVFVTVDAVRVELPMHRGMHAATEVFRSCLDDQMRWVHASTVDARLASATLTNRRSLVVASVADITFREAHDEPMRVHDSSIEGKPSIPVGVDMIFRPEDTFSHALNPTPWGTVK